MTYEDTPGKNTRGLPLALRFVGVFLPLAAFWASFLLLSPDQTPRAGSAFFQVLAWLWSWPYAMYQQEPLAFGLLALLSLVLAAVLFGRRDWRGAVTALIWCFFWGWLLATIIGQARGT